MNCQIATMNINNFNFNSRISKKTFLLVFLFLFAVLFIASVRKADSNPHKTGMFLAVSGGDTNGYIDPIKNLIAEGEFFGQSGGNEKNHIGRGPYYGILYYFFQLFLPSKIAFDAVVLLQIFLLALALTYLLKIINRFVENKILLWFAALMFVFLPLAARYVIVIMPETISLSTLILFCYFYLKFLDTCKNKYLLISGIFIGITCVLKPYFFPVYAIVGLIYCFDIRWNFKKIFHYVFIISIPVVVICTPFTVRNLIRFQVFAPVQNTTYGGGTMDENLRAMRSTFRVWGENFVNWENTTLGTYFLPVNDIFEYKYDFPKRLIVDGYTMQDIENLRALCRQAGKTDSVDLLIQSEFERMRNIFIEQKPFEAYFFSRIRTTLLLLRSPLYFSANEVTNLKQAAVFTLQYSRQILYYFILVFGLIGIIWLCVENRKYLFIALIPFWLILFFGIILQWTEERFFKHGFFLLYIGAFFFIDKIILFVKQKIKKYDTIQ